MTFYSLCIKARFCPEVVERILRVARHRGFELCSLNMNSLHESTNRQVVLLLTVSSNKKIHLLLSQLNKLVDVYCVEMQ